MKRRATRIALPLLAVILLTLCFGWQSGALAEEIYTVQVSGTYGQTEARRMLDMINDFRTGGDAWYWNADDESKTLCEDLEPLVYDSGLEKVAMQRAAEIALSFEHTRPDQSDCFTAYSLSGATYWAQGENIAAGYPGAEATFVQWREDDYGYSGQGHRRSMLSASFNAVGIGHIRFNGMHYWVQEFGYARTPNTTQTSPNDALTSVDVQIAASALTAAELSFEPASLVLSPGESADLPACTAKIDVVDAWPGGLVPVDVRCAWASDSDAVASLDGEGHVTAGEIGNANLTATALGRTGTVPVKVADATVQPTGISLEPSEPQTLYIGAELQLQAILEPADVKCDVEWSASYDGEAPLSVSDAGLVTPLRPGRATVTASAKSLSPSGESLSASVNITVLDPSEPTGIRIEPAGPVRLNLGEALRMSAVLEPASVQAAEITWHIDSAGIASLDEDLMLTGLREGTATCYASVTVHRPEPVELKSNEVEIRVIDPQRPTAITLDKSGTVELNLGDALRLNATLEPATAVSELEWSSSNEQVAQVDGDGNVTPQECGTAIITVKAAKRSAEGAELSASVTVNIVDPHPIDPTKPTGIALDKSGMVELNLGDTLRLNATLEPETAVSALEWSSSNGSAATVSGDGLVTAVGEGSTVITVKAVERSAEGEELSASVTINVVDPHPIDPTKPTGIALDKSGVVELNIGDTLRLNATLTPETAVSALEWSSSNGSAATVSGDGLVTAVGEGSAVITVKAVERSAEGEELSASVTINVVDPHPIDPTKPTGIALDKSGMVELNLGDTLRLNATLTPETAVSALEWSSSNGSAATVSGDGLVTAVGEGSTVITVKAVERSAEGEELSASVTINVTNPNQPGPDEPGPDEPDPDEPDPDEPGPDEPGKLAKLTLNPSGTVELDIRETLQLQAIWEPAGAECALDWSSSKASVARVDGSGKVTPAGAGEAIITAVAEDGSDAPLTASVTIRVVNPEAASSAKPTKLTLDRSGTVKLDTDKTLRLNATLEPATAWSELKWSSSNKKVAKVDANGKVTPGAEGKAKITVTSVRKGAKGKKLSASVKIQVVDPYKPAGVSIDQPGPLQVNIGETLTLTATMQPVDARSSLSWSSSNKKIAKVEYDAEAGACVVTGKKAGSAKITVKTRNGKKKTVSLKVVDPTKATGVTLNFSGTVELPMGETLELIATMQPATATSKLSWSSSNKKIATVKAASAEDIAAGRAQPESCVVTPKRTGTVKITVKTSTGKKASVKLKIVAAKDLPEDAEEPIESAEEPPMEVQNEAAADAPEAENLPEDAEESIELAEELPMEVEIEAAVDAPEAENLPEEES